MKPEGNPVHEVGQELSLRICTRVYLPQPATVGPLYIILLHFDIQISNRKVHHCPPLSARARCSIIAAQSWAPGGCTLKEARARREPGESESQDLTLSHFVHMVFRCAY